MINEKNWPGRRAPLSFVVLSTSIGPNADGQTAAPKAILVCEVKMHRFRMAEKKELCCSFFGTADSSA